MSAIAAMMQQFFQPSGGPPPNMPPDMPPEMPGIASPIPSAPGGLLMPPPHAAPMPTITAPKQTSLLERVKHSLLTMGEPEDATAYRGLLSDQEIHGAKPGFMARLSSITPGALTPGQQYQGSLDHMVAVKHAASQMVEQQRAKQAQEQLATTRAAIANRFPELPESASPQQQVQRLMSMFTAYARAGDTESASKVGEVLKSMGGVMEGPKPADKTMTPHSVMVDGKAAEVFSDGKGHFSYADGKPVTGSITPYVAPARTSEIADDLKNQRMFQREQQLADDFRSATKQHADVAGMIGVIEASARPARTGDAAAQQSIIYGIMKLNDPGSSVKEGEYATAQNAQGVPEKVRNEYNRLLKGTTLSAEAVDRYIAQANRLKGTWQSKFKTISGMYERRATQWGVKPENVVLDYFGSAPKAPEAPAAVGSAVKAKIGGIRP